MTAHVITDSVYLAETVGTCDLCGSGTRQESRVQGLEAENIILCDACSLVQTSPRPTREGISACYPDTYTAHLPSSRSRRFFDWIKSLQIRDQLQGNAPSHWFARGGVRALGRLFLCVIPPPAGAPGKLRLLDVGCGAGHSLIQAKKRGWDAHGIEPNTNAVAVARSYGLTQVHKGTLDTSSYPTGYFHAVTMFHVLEHVHSPTEALRVCRRILREDGFCLVVVPNFGSYPRRVMRKYWQHLDIPRHLYHFDETTLRRLADKCGFEVAEVRFSSPLTTLMLNILSAIKTASWMRRHVLSFSCYGYLKGIVQGLLGALGDRSLHMGDVMLFRLRPMIAKP